MKIQFSFFLFFVFFNSTAQHSISTAGGDFITKEGTVSFSIGEVFYTIKGKYYNISEGLQNSYIINPIFTFGSLHISLFPNPTIDLIFFKVENYNYLDLSYIMYDLKGNTIIDGIIANSNSFISLKNLPSQTYIIRCLRGTKEQNVFRIIKL